MDQLMVTITLDEYRALIEKVTRYELLEELVKDYLNRNDK